MSRGKWQKAILRAVETQEWVKVRDLLPKKHTKAQYSSLMRAAQTLQREGLIVDRVPTVKLVRKRQAGEPIQK